MSLKETRRPSSGFPSFFRDSSSKYELNRLFLSLSPAPRLSLFLFGCRTPRGILIRWWNLRGERKRRDETTLHSYHSHFGYRVVSYIKPLRVCIEMKRVFERLRNIYMYINCTLHMLGVLHTYIGFRTRLNSLNRAFIEEDVPELQDCRFQEKSREKRKQKKSVPASLKEGDAHRERIIRMNGKTGAGEIER